MKVLAAALAAIVFAPGTDDDVLARTQARIVGTELSGRSCMEALAGTREPGLATISFQYRVEGGTRDAGGRYDGRVTFTIDQVVITLPESISWPRMSRLDRRRAEALRSAILHHEVGHVRVAEAVRDAFNARAAIVEPDAFAFRAAADALGREGFERFKSAERDYDALTNHGRRQHAAPAALAGFDTILECATG